MKPLYALLAVTVLAAGQHADARTARAADPAEIRAALGFYGTCIVKREGEIASKALLSGEFLDTRSDDGKRLVQKECLADRVTVARFNDASLKGAMADALVARGLDRLTATSFDGVPALTYAEPWPVRLTDRNGSDLPPERVAAQQRKFEEKQGEVARAKMAECVTRAAGAPVRALFATPAASQAELAALQAVAPSLAGCLPAGQTIGFDRMTLRGALAVAYYRLASAAQPSGAAQ
ncbi:hypothetical protein [Novosphingobium sp.]|uniref:hypothetical protein n=1 Tax=Novosphingobium sp. TaxID=1874826 RepID=UPI002735EDEF|nr:hypothetical protein [Novosphingobium sp.]MDP3906053.1 hypothetical protein [Novosphingobium sp.]